MRNGHTTAFFLIGFAPLAAQIILVRELLVIFYGNELSLGIMLASWLLWTGLGSVILGRLSDRIPSKERVLALVQALLAFLLPLTIICIRLAKTFLGIPPGEIIDLASMTAVTFIILAPFCFCSGFFFALACSLDSEARGGDAGSAMGRVFFLEAAGAGTGGLITSLFFLRYLNHIQAACIVSMLLVLSAAFLAGFRSPRRGGARAGGDPAVEAVIVFGSGVAAGGAIDRITRQWEWRGYEHSVSRDTLYGNVTAVTSAGQTSFYENGLWLFTSPDPRSAEEAVHFALLQHREPRRVLLAGGGISSSLAEILKHPSLERVDYVELDPAIIAMGRRLLPPQGTAVLDDPRVRLIHKDGRQHVRTTSMTYDVIIIDLPDPMTAQVNRFYTADFFAEARRILCDDGVFALGVTGAETMIGPNLARLLASLRLTMSTVFTEVIVYPGAAARFFGSPSPGVLVADPAVLVDRIDERDLALDYVRDYYLLFTLAPERRRFLENILDGTKAGPVNRDLSPSLYYDSLVFWSAQYTPGVARLLRSAETIHLAAILLAGLAATALVMAARRRYRRSAAALPVVYACFTAGYTEMTLTVLLILAFQVLYGYVYYTIALLLTAYMIGLMVGSRLMASRLDRLSRPVETLALVQAALALYSLALWAMLPFLHGLSPLSPAWAAWERGFPLLLVGAGVLGGLHFPLSGKLYAAHTAGTGRTAGMIYGVDLAGSALGALLAGIMLLPALGIPHTLVMLAVFNLVAAAWVVANRADRHA